MTFKKAIVSTLLALTSLLAASPAWTQRGNPRMEYGGQSIDAMIAVFMAENGVPGLALAIVQAPYIPRMTGYGLADTGKQLLVGSGTAFDLGQMAEAYTAVAVMQLVETNRLGLGDPVGKYLEGLPDAWRHVTIRMLLSHSSGLPDYTRTQLFDPTRPADQASVTALVGASPLAFDPGSGAAASATEYFLLARVVEVASGERFEDFVRKNQFERLGLRQTFFSGELDRGRGEPVEQNGGRHKEFLADPRFIAPTERATGYRAGGGGLSPLVVVDPRSRLGSGGILASAMDVSVWDIGLAGAVLVKDPAMRALLYNPAELSGGRRVPVMGAWRFPGRKGLMYVTGNGDGQSAFLSRFTDPSELVCVTLLANKDGLDMSQLARRIAGAYDPRLGPPPVLGMRLQQSPYPARETLARFKKAMLGLGAKVVGDAASTGAQGAKASPGEMGAEGAKAQAAKSGQEAKAPVVESAQPERMAFDFPVSGAKTVRVTARAWERDGQVWLGCSEPAGLGGPGTTSGVLRVKLDRALLAAVTPY